MGYLQPRLQRGLLVHEIFLAVIDSGRKCKKEEYTTRLLVVYYGIVWTGEDTFVQLGYV